jgi:ABC-type nitrate/sulfonate/bicarbonate transport system substrate-binding protein
MTRATIAGLGALVLSLAAAANPTLAQGLDKLSIVIFGPPSLGAFLPPIIKAQKLDEKHGLSISFEERTPDAYAAQFNSGEFKLGGSAALLTVGLADIRGVKVTYLFNLFDYWGAVVTSKPEVKTLKDLEGKDLVAAKGTTNYVMFEWFARQLGVDTGTFSVVNTATPGLVGYAVADRATAVQLWEPAYTVLLAKKPGIRNARPQDRRELGEIRRQSQHPVSRRGGACVVGGRERAPRSEAVRDLPGGGAMDHGQSRRGRQAHQPARHRGRPEGHRRSDSRQ